MTSPAFASWASHCGTSPALFERELEKSGWSAGGKNPARERETAVPALFGSRAGNCHVLRGKNQFFY
jgi:hypothetical protein